jgi:hypothetical protein
MQTAVMPKYTFDLCGVSDHFINLNGMAPSLRAIIDPQASRMPQ